MALYFLNYRRDKKNLNLVTEESVRDAVNALHEEEIEPSRLAVAEKLGVSVEVLAGLSFINNIDLVYLGVAGRQKLTEEGVRDAVRVLGERATRTNVSAWLGVHYNTLIIWADRNGYNLERVFGVVSFLITEEAIRNAVQKLIEAGRAPTRSVVCDEMGITLGGLDDWAMRNEINLAVLGIIKKVITKEKIEAAVTDLKKRGIQPAIDNVADALYVDVVPLMNWERENGVDLSQLGVVIRRRPVITLERIQQAMERLKEDGIEPTRTNVARILGCVPRSISAWAWRTGKSLRDIGLVEVKMTEENIWQAVTAITSRGMVPTRARVAEKLDVEYSSLTSWFSEKNRPSYFWHSGCGTRERIFIE